MKEAILIFGLPLSGKKIQSELLSQKPEYHLFSLNKFLQEEMSKGTKFGLYAKGFAAREKSVPDSVFMPILKEVIINLYKEHDKVIFEGVPSTINQAKFFNQIVNAQEARITKTFLLVASRGTLLERVRKELSEKESKENEKEVLNKKLQLHKGNSQKVIDSFFANAIKIDASEPIDAVHETIMSNF